MGSISAMESIERVLKKYGAAITHELRQQYPTRLIRDFTLSNQTYEIAVGANLKDGTWIELRPLDIDELAERYPDCNVGY